MEQELEDQEQSEIEIKKVSEDLIHQIHDQKVARMISSMADVDWGRWGDRFEKPFGKGSSKNVIWVENKDEEEEDDDEDVAVFRLYFKSLVREEKVGNEKTLMARIGVAICDPRDNLVFELRKPLFGKGLNKVAAYAKALIEGLNDALTLELKKIILYCENYTFHQFVSLFLPSLLCDFQFEFLIFDCIREVILW